MKHTKIIFKANIKLEEAGENTLMGKTNQGPQAFNLGKKIKGLRSLSLKTLSKTELTHVSKSLF